MADKLRVGVIGAGGIAQSIHLPNYQKQADKVELVAIADVAHERARQAAEQFGIRHHYADYEQMLREVELDAVSVCTPNKFHAPAAIAALQAGCNVLCEKPPAMTVAEAEAMAEAAARSGKILTYGLHYRYTPEVLALKRFIDAGELGEVYAARSHAVRRRGIPGWGVFTNKELQGGGALIDIGVHMLDTALHLMGYPEPELVMGSTYQRLGTRKGVGLLGQWDWQNFTVEDMARGFIRFKNGATLVLEAAFAANVEKADVMQVQLMGVEGGADVFPLKIYQEKQDTLIDVTPVYLPKKGGHEAEVEAFVAACLGGPKPLATPEQGVTLQKIINAVYQSAETGEAVRIG
ncbi:Gfo/Idh/MocA family protein [Alicyclobacillus kakegawensis]|uniref:Gfo/Idh/MocA family protein n=1 Tax=Alicyclobacillus kakegawensis TaxID=392012 RepID=UPI000830839B|nr:Gfo/Idh/MocA family oxidoreductase [Alicyclobacillus kakegawensis]